MGSVSLGHPQRIFKRVKFEDAPSQRTMATPKPNAVNAFKHSIKNSCRMLESMELGTEK